MRATLARRRSCASRSPGSRAASSRRIAARCPPVSAGPPAADAAPAIRESRDRGDRRRPVPAADRPDRRRGRRGRPHGRRRGAPPCARALAGDGRDARREPLLQLRGLAGGRDRADAGDAGDGRGARRAARDPLGGAPDPVRSHHERAARRRLPARALGPLRQPLDGARRLQLGPGPDRPPPAPGHRACPTSTRASCSKPTPSAAVAPSPIRIRERAVEAAEGGSRAKARKVGSGST